MQGLTSQPFASFPPSDPQKLQWHRRLACASTLRIALTLFCPLAQACAQPAAEKPAADNPSATPSKSPLKPASEWVIASPPNTKRPPFNFAKDDEALLDEVQKGAFSFLYNACDPATGMVVDRSSVTFASTAGVGFQLAALPAAVERGWITKDQGNDRALLILKSLAAGKDNRKAGFFYHFLDGKTAAPIDNDVVSTVDSALLFCGVLTAGMYFNGEVRTIGDDLFRSADFSFFVEHTPKPDEPHMKGFISLGWKPINFKDPTGPGKIIPYYWADAGDEGKLVYLLGASAPDDNHRTDPALYFRMRRQLGDYPGVPPHFWFPWSGALFKDFFAHCFVNYAHRGPDNPAAADVERRPQIDWWENSRRAVALHRVKAKENPKHLPTFGENAWGLSASDNAKGYAVPGLFPALIKTSDAQRDTDFSVFTPKDDYGDGTIAPYAAGSSIMFEPDAAIAALRYFRTLKAPDGSPLIWREPGKVAGANQHGFRDSFNLGTGWVAPDHVAIDQGPLFLAIENARSGLIWTLFESHPWVKAGWERMKVEAPGRGSDSGNP